MGLFVRNEGTVDRIIRAVIGVVALVLAFTTFTDVLQIIALIVGILMLFTAATGSCMLYRVFGINTCPPQQRS
jgi:hypothetical protein